MKSKKAGDAVSVSGGCLPLDSACDSEEKDCQDVNELEECEKCCGQNGCLKEDLTTGLHQNLAPTMSANLALLLGALTLLFLGA